MKEQTAIILREDNLSETIRAINTDNQGDSNSFSYENEEEKGDFFPIEFVVSSKMILEGIQKKDEFKKTFIESYWEDTAHMLNTYTSSLTTQLKYVFQHYK